MKNIYLISNNLMSKTKINFMESYDLNKLRKYTMLSQKGEENAFLLSKNKHLENGQIIISSPYFNALETAKIIAKEHKLDILINENLSERLVGDLGINEYSFLKGMQEHDFSYKLTNGESLNEVTKRMKETLIDILKIPNEEIIVVTHNIAIMSLLTLFCHKDYNLEDHLLLSYQDKNIFDGVFHEIDLIKLTFAEKKLLNIERIL